MLDEEMADAGEVAEMLGGEDAQGDASEANDAPRALAASVLLPFTPAAHVRVVCFLFCRPSLQLA